jgi:hypothetical protein
MNKLADLLGNVSLQPHQQALADEAEEAARQGKPLRKMLLWSLGSGKSLGALSAAERLGGSYGAVVPAALRPNLQKEVSKFTTSRPDVVSYNRLAQGGAPQDINTLIADEAHRLREPGSLQSQEFAQAARKAKNLLLLSGSPLVNRPSDLAVPTSLLTGKNISPQQFEERYVGEKRVSPGLLARLRGIKPSTEPEIQNEEELKALLKGHVDYYAPDKPVVPVTHEDVPVEMGVEQSRLYRAMWDQLPWHLRWKLKHQFPLSRQELMRTQSFLSGPRQVGLSTLPYLKNQDPETAFSQSPKLQMALSKLQETLKDERAKALVFSNFIGAGLTPYSHALTKHNIPHAVFHGGLSDAQRKQLVEDYNADKIRVALLGPSGTEGLSFRGTQAVQLLDPHWQGVRGRQAIGRGLRYDSHLGLPEELQHMKVQRFISRLPLGMADRLLERVGMDRTQRSFGADDYLSRMAEKKEKLNQKFMDLLRESGTRGQ